MVIIPVLLLEAHGPRFQSPWFGQWLCVVTSGQRKGRMWYHVGEPQRFVSLPEECFRLGAGDFEDAVRWIMYEGGEAALDKARRLLGNREIRQWKLRSYDLVDTHPCGVLEYKEKDPWKQETERSE